MTTAAELRSAERLPAPEYTNPAEASAIGRIRREGRGLVRVIAQVPAGTGEHFFGYDLPAHDARLMARELTFNRYRNVETSAL